MRDHMEVPDSIRKSSTVTQVGYMPATRIQASIWPGTLLWGITLGQGSSRVCRITQSTLPNSPVTLDLFGKLLDTETDTETLFEFNGVKHYWKLCPVIVLDLQARLRMHQGELEHQ